MMVSRTSMPLRPGITQVGKDDLGMVAVNQFQAFSRITCDSDVQTILLKGRRQKFEAPCIVIDKNEGNSVLFHALRSTPYGRQNLKLLPMPTWLSSQILPACISTRCFVIDSPSPVPSRVPRVVGSNCENLSKTRSSSDGAMPIPVSATQKNASSGRVTL